MSVKSQVCFYKYYSKPLQAMIAKFLTQFKVSQIHDHYSEFVEIARTCAIDFPSAPEGWPTFWTELNSRMTTKSFPISFQHLKYRHVGVGKLQTDLAKELLTECRDWSMVQDGYESAFARLKTLAPSRRDYLGVVVAIAHRSAEARSAIEVSQYEIGHFLVWKDARNMLCHKSSPKNHAFFEKLAATPSTYIRVGNAMLADELRAPVAPKPVAVPVAVPVAPKPVAVPVAVPVLPQKLWQSHAATDETEYWRAKLNEVKEKKKLFQSMYQ